MVFRWKVAWALALLAACCSARDFTFTFKVAPGRSECFYDYIYEGAFLEIEYQVRTSLCAYYNFTVIAYQLASTLKDIHFCVVAYARSLWAPIHVFFFPCVCECCQVNFCQLLQNWHHTSWWCINGFKTSHLITGDRGW